MANVSSSNGLEKRPKLRFPGFDEPWEHKELLHYLVENTDRNKQLKFGKENVLSVSGEYGIVNQIAFQGRSFAGESVADYHVVETDDIVYTKSPLKANPYGIIKVNKGVPGIVSTLYAVYHPLNTVVPRFVDFYFSNDLRLNKFLKPLVNIGAKHDMKVNNTFVLTGTVVFPPLREQQKIVDFLTILDRRIDVQRKKVEALKKYKRGVVSAILSHRIVFSDADGKPYPEWTSCTLQDAVVFLDGQRKPLESADRARRQGKYPYYGASGIIDYIDDYIFDEPLLLLGEDGANIINRSTPLCFIATGKYWVNNHAHVMRPQNGHNIKFLCELLESLDYTRYNTGTAQPKLNQEKCRGIELNLPIYEEQCRIADFLSSLDQKAEREQANLDCLLLFKRGLMQQLFI